MVAMGIGTAAIAQSGSDIKLNSPSRSRGTDIMQALQERKSTRTFADKELSSQDLSDVLWAANGINRPESGKRTAPSAMNRQDVKVYVCLRSGAYLYDPQDNMLRFLTEGDATFGKAPAVIVLVADEDTKMGAVDTGIVSQNISLMCAGAGLATYPRASFDEHYLRRILKLGDKQTVILCHPVGYFE